MNLVSVRILEKKAKNPFSEKYKSEKKREKIEKPLIMSVSINYANVLLEVAKKLMFANILNILFK